MSGATPKSDDAQKQALERLDDQLSAFEAGRGSSAGGGSAVKMRGVSDGYRLVAGLIGGVLGGTGLGWFADLLLHTSPIGLICGLLIGAVVSIVGAVVSASRMSAQAAARSGAVPPAGHVPDDEDDE